MEDQTPLWVIEEDEFRARWTERQNERARAQRLRNREQLENAMRLQALKASK